VQRRKPVSYQFLLVVVLLAVAAEAQLPAKIPRIGFLIASSPSANTARIEAFRQGLRELGYVEGKNIVAANPFPTGSL
jgi:putative ABC transport system substrate-binding protein